MTSFSPERIAIIGTGLIGGSLARAIAEHFTTTHIAAYDANATSLAYGKEQGVLHSTHTQAIDAVRDADCVFFATPPSTLAALASEIAPALKNGVIISDVTSVKRFAIDVIAAALPQGVYFVPGHPIAGSEKTGIESSSATLFNDKRVILTPEEAMLRHDSVKSISVLWQTLGARIEYMPAELHDCLYAYVSHLPQMVAFAMMPCLSGIDVPQGEVFTSFTRLSHSSPALWTEIALANADFMCKAIRDFQAFAIQMASELTMAEEPSEPIDPALCAHLFAQVIATCLIACSSLIEDQMGVRAARYAGRGFSDMTAAAGSDPEAALGAISAQAKTISSMLNMLVKQLERLDNAIAERSPEKLYSVFAGGN